MAETKTLEVFGRKDFRKWLEKNHDKENKVALVMHKKHTGKTSPSHKELMEEAICFGWIDTTIKRLDEDKFIRRFSRRNKNSKWSDNTLSYAKELIGKKRMTPHGMKFYLDGLKKPTHDHEIPKDPKVPKEFKDALSKNKIAKERFDKLSKSNRRTYLRWLLRAKLPETRKKRTDAIVKRMSTGNTKIGTSLKVNS